MEIKKFLSHFDGVKKIQDEFQAKCPAHDDRKASLSVSEGRKGIVLYCHAGCETENILSKIGIEPKDLFYNNGRDNGTPKKKIVDEYIYTDESGKPLYKSVRLEPKAFYQMRYEGGTWINGTQGVRKVLYNLPSVIKAAKDGGMIFVCEGEKDCHTLEQQGLTATCNVGGASKWKTEYNEFLRGTSVVILPHNDGAGREHGETVAESLRGIAASVKVISLDVKEDKEDVTDWINKYGHTVDELKEIVRSSDEWKPGKVLKLVKSEGTKKEEKTEKKKKKKQGSAITFHDPTPSSEPVNAADLFDEIYETIGRFIYCGENEKVAISLFILHAHAFDVSECTPILGITSPEKRCGKSTLLSVLKALCPRAVSTSNVSAAVMYRIIEAARPTILIDEADAFAKERNDLRGVINAGHSRSDAHVLRCDGDDYEPRAFNVYCPKAIAMIGTLKDLGDTVADRAINVRLQRAGVGERVERFRRKQREGLLELHSKIARWANDNIDLLKTIEPDIPEELNDRAADGWEPLLAIADLIGEEMPDIARDAAKRLSGIEDVGSISTELLQDIKNIFDETNVTDAIPTSELLDKLNKLEESPWKGYHRGKEMSGRGLSKLLKPFGIESKRMRIDTGQVRGYDLKDFEDAFKRYLPPGVSVTSVKTNKNKDLQPSQGDIF